MNESEFHKRATEDIAFRRSKIDDLRYYKQVGAGLMWVCAILGLVFSVYCGMTAGKWDKGVGLLIVGGLVYPGYARCANRLATLQSVDIAKPDDFQ